MSEEQLDLEWSIEELKKLGVEVCLAMYNRLANELLDRMRRRDELQTFGLFTFAIPSLSLLQSSIPGIGIVALFFVPVIYFIVRKWNENNTKIGWIAQKLRAIEEAVKMPVTSWEADSPPSHQAVF